MKRQRLPILIGVLALGFAAVWLTRPTSPTGLLIDTGAQRGLPFLVSITREGADGRDSSADVVVRQWLKSGSRAALATKRFGDQRWELEVLHPAFVPVTVPVEPDGAGGITQTVQTLHWSHRIANGGSVGSSDVERHLAFVRSKWLAEGGPTLELAQRQRILLVLRRLYALGICDAAISQTACRALKARAREHLDAIEAALGGADASQSAPEIQDAPAPARRRPDVPDA